MTEEVDAHLLDRYDLQKRLGKGAYGIVWKAYDKRSKETVALKKIFDAFRNQTDSQRTFREVMFLQEFGRHSNVIKLFNIIKADNDRDIYLVFEYMEADLHNVIKKVTILKDIHKQYIMCQLFRAIRYLHSGNVLHRDLKPSNVLLDADCRVKLADFGLARSLSSLEDYPEGTNMPELTEYVATRWYRSPEILLAAKRYTKGVDMWSLGCILGEMLLGRALFPGTSTINQIERIMNSISRPSRSDIESIGSHYAASVLDKMPMRARKPLDHLVNTHDHNALHLMHNLLVFAPHRRLNIQQCLVHPYVLQFHNPADEPALDYDVTLPLPDHIQLGIQDYRDKLYEMIQEKRANVRKLHHERINPVPVTPSRVTTSSSAEGRGAGDSGHNSGHRRASAQERPMERNDRMERNERHERTAPIAQAECSDTDYDTARSAARMPNGSSNGTGGHRQWAADSHPLPTGADQHLNSGYVSIAEMRARERAQSADVRSRQSRSTNPSQSNNIEGSKRHKERRRSHDRAPIFSALRGNKFVPPSSHSQSRTLISSNAR